MRKRQLNYLKCIVIVHGKSELQICQYIKQEMRMMMEIISEKSGKNSIQINGLMNILSDSRFKTCKAFCQKFENVKIEENRKFLDCNFRIFIIMDTDDCEDPKKLQSYISGELFNGHWAKDYIRPIYNTPDLESVLVKSGITFRKKGKERKKEYIEIFPTDDQNKNRGKLEVEEFQKMLERTNTTNMDEFVKFCLLNA